MEKIEKFTLINKDRSRIKVFEPFEDVSNTFILFLSLFIRINLSITCL